MGGPPRSPCKRAGVSPSPCARAVSEGRGGESPGAPRDHTPLGPGGTGWLPEEVTAPTSGVYALRQESQQVIAIIIVVVIVPGHVKVCAC